MSKSDEFPAGDITEGSSAWPTALRPTSIGLGIPVSEQAAGADFPHFDDLLAVSRIAADAGFEALWYADHFSFESDQGLRGSWDVWTAMAAIAASVPNVQIGSMVACTAYRNPGVIAKMTEMIDEISGGRFILGLGAGWNRPEYDQFGFPFEPRVTRFEEALTIIHGMLRNGEVDFQGMYYQANKAVNLPRGPRPAGPPILIGTGGDRMLRILARYADAWDTGWGGDTAGLSKKVARLEAACQDVGRDPATVVRSVGVSFAGEGFTGDPATTFQGTNEEKVRFLEEMAALGFRHIRIGLQPFSHGAVESLAPVIEAFHNRS
jgi:alkanesulfonate monooxygenase SsuD/methylene tetrahydromethanopterin reductase-like flavin-dependent oxidoreductase (luciferase family)